MDEAGNLVTGGAGFLGRRLVERLLMAGRSATVLGRKPAPDLEARGVRFIRASLEDADALHAACKGIGTVFHLAARVGIWGRYEDFYQTNVVGTRNLLAACRAAGVRRFVHTSTPSVVYNGGDLAGADESLPLTTKCPSAYALTKALAEGEVLAANGAALRTVALRPHLIWGPDDPHLIPRLVDRAARGRLRIIGSGRNRVDMVHVENAVDAQLLAEKALRTSHLISDVSTDRRAADGRAYFITNGEPVVLWDWINHLLEAIGEKPVRRRISLGAGLALGAACELAWRLPGVRGEPPLTRFVAAELAREHWFDITAARRDLGYQPRISMAQGTEELVETLRLKRGRASMPMRP